MSNPTRGCGTKKHDSFYIEGIFSSTGTLWAFTWLLGFTQLGQEYLPVSFTDRKPDVINPIATVMERERWLADTPYRPAPDRQDEYKMFYRSMRRVGMGDHVSKKFYSAYSFAEELKEYGPSRKVSKLMAITAAKLIENFGPIPVMFSHDRMPIFRNDKEREEATRHVERCFTVTWEGKHWEPTWRIENWGMYARNDQYWGYKHCLIPILNLVHAIEKDWQMVKHRNEYVAAKEFFEMVNFVEQPFGLSWFTRVSYTLPKDGETPQDISDIPGINVIDLSKEEQS